MNSKSLTNRSWLDTAIVLVASMLLGVIGNVWADSETVSGKSDGLGFRASRWAGRRTQIMAGARPEYFVSVSGWVLKDPAEVQRFNFFGILTIHLSKK